MAEVDCQSIQCTSNVVLQLDYALVGQNVLSVASASRDTDASTAFQAQSSVYLNAA